MRFTILRPSLRAVCAGLALFGFALPSLCAQGKLQDLQKRFVEERDELIREKQGRIEPADFQALAARHATALAEWLDSHPDDADAVDARLMLTNIRMDVDEIEQAKATLAGIDPARATALQLAVAAEMAQVLRMDEQRAAWVDAAIAKETSLDDRMALAMFLMTRLLEVEKGEAIFASATADANDDEQRAEIAFHRATAIRMREDLPDGAYEQALDELAKAWPATYWGSVAADRLAALSLSVGSPAIEIEGPTLEGGRISLSKLREDQQVVLLDFWNAASVRDPRVPTVLKRLQEDYGERGFQILGINLDADAERAKAAVKERGMDWPHLSDGRGWKTDAALRYAIESVPYQLLIDSRGQVAALRVFLLDDYGVQELRDAIDKALSAKARD